MMYRRRAIVWCLLFVILDGSIVRLNSSGIFGSNYGANLYHVLRINQDCGAGRRNIFIMTSDPGRTAFDAAARCSTNLANLSETDPS